MQRVSWSVEEMIAMVDIYFRNKNNGIDDLSLELIRLSQKLNKRADVLGIKHDEKFRNYNGMKMIFQNVRYVDTNGEDGFSGASQLINEVIDLYYNNLPIFRRILNEFNERYK